MTERRVPPQWGNSIVSRPGIEPRPVFGSLAPPDYFEQRLAAFASRRGIDISKPEGRMFALEIAARAHPEMGDEKPEPGRPAELPFFKSLPSSSDREVLRIVGQYRVAPDISETKALALFIEAEEGLKPGDRLFQASLEKWRKRLTKARKKMGTPRKRGRPKKGKE